MKITPIQHAPLPKEPVNAELEKVSRHFEALFTNQMIRTMRQTVPTDGLMPQSSSEKIYQGMLDEQYAGKIADTGELGLAKVIYNQLLRQKGIR